MLVHVLERRLRQEILGTCGTLLDVGCGTNSPIRSFSESLGRTVGVDAFEPSLKVSAEAGIHSEYYQLDALSILDKFGENAFECVIASDLIEHLTKEGGLRLIEMMERVAKKKVIVFTPGGFVPQDVYEENELQRHLSGWDAPELRQMGYRVNGIAGWRKLRGERGEILWRPRTFWLAVSGISQIIAYRRPEFAFQILAVKELS